MPHVQNPADLSLGADAKNEIQETQGLGFLLMERQRYAVTISESMVLLSLRYELSARKPST
jgi:hypothetical protein